MRIEETKSTDLCEKVRTTAAKTDNRKLKQIRIWMAKKQLHRSRICRVIYGLAAGLLTELGISLSKLSRANARGTTRNCEAVFSFNVRNYRHHRRE
jgi:hypothetical protein